MLATTFNVHCDILAKITGAAVRLNKTRRDIIVFLLMRIMEDHDGLIRGFTTVKYQHDDERISWHCFHIRLKHDEYEYFVDLRKVCKCSISLLIAIAVDRYIDELAKCIKKVVDNYPLFSNYVSHLEVIDGIFCLHFFWGFPEAYLKTLLPHTYE